MTDLRQAAQAVLDAWDSPLWKTGTTAAKIADLRTALAIHQVSEFAQQQQQAEPECWCHKCNENKVVNNIPFGMTRMIVCPTCGNKRCPKASDHRLDCTGSNETGQPGSVYTTSPQRQWVGLTDEDVNRESAPIASQMKLAFHAGMYVAQKILKEKNT